MTVPDLLISRIRYRNRDSVPAFAKYIMGHLVYTRSGLQHYIERLYCMKDEDVGLEFALQRLGEAQEYAPMKIVRQMLHRMRRRTKSPGTTGVPHALVHPKDGFGEVYSKIGQSLIDIGVNVRLGCSIKTVRRLEESGFEIDVGEHREHYDNVVSTLPIPIMLRLLGVSKAESVEYISLLSLFYRGKIRHNASFLYNFTMSGCWKRITVFSTFYGSADGGDYFTVEITTQDTSPDAVERLRSEFEQHAAKVLLFEPTVPITYVGNTITERAYPLFRKGKAEEIQADRDRLSEFGIDFVGRQGSFAYLSSHDAALQAASMAAEIGYAP